MHVALLARRAAFSLMYVLVMFLVTRARFSFCARFSVLMLSSLTSFSAPFLLSFLPLGLVCLFVSLASFGVFLLFGLHVMVLLLVIVALF